MLAPTPTSRPSPTALPLSDVSLGPVVMADDPCEAAFGNADPTGPRKYYRARYYNPQLGRFVSEDPIGFRGGDNFYAYADNNPTNRTDPFGLAASSNGCCNQDWLTCMVNCLERFNPLGPGGTTILTGAGGTFPKVLIGAPTVLGASRMTTIPSAAGGAAVRGVGRFFSPIWIIYGDYLFFVQIHCAAACAGWACSY